MKHYESVELKRLIQVMQQATVDMMKGGTKAYDAWLTASENVDNFINSLIRE